MTRHICIAFAAVLTPLVIAFYYGGHGPAPDNVLLLYLFFRSPVIIAGIIVGLVFGKLVGQPLQKLDDKYPIKWRRRSEERPEESD